MNETAGEGKRGSVPEVPRSDTFNGLSAAESIRNEILETRKAARALYETIDKKRGQIRETSDGSLTAKALLDVIDRDVDFLDHIAAPTTYRRDPYSLENEENVKDISQTERIKLATAKIAEIAKRYEPGEGEAMMQKMVDEMLPTTTKNENTREGHEERARKLMQDMERFRDDLREAGESGGDFWDAALRALQGKYGYGFTSETGKK